MSVFQFKEFAVDQRDCPMKINTDGVLLGALADVDQRRKVLDIGTGTGVVALMLAQRNHQSDIDAIDIDLTAFERAGANFEGSLFHNRLKVYHHSFVDFFELNPMNNYDLIVSNPPFFLNSLRSGKAQKNIARHTDIHFFVHLLRLCSLHLSVNGALELIVPMDLSEVIINLGSDYGLQTTQAIRIKSFENKEPFRNILKLEKNTDKALEEKDFVIYEREKEHSLQYRTALKDFFTIF